MPWCSSRSCLTTVSAPGTVQCRRLDTYLDGVHGVRKLTIEELHNLASEFRKGFGVADLSEAPGLLSNFPESCCNWASYVVGHFLKFEMNLNPIEIQASRMGKRGTEHHAWLQLDETVIDITSDQFEDSKNKVIVSNHSQWHSKWIVDEKLEIKDISEYDDIGCGASLTASKLYDFLASRVKEKCT